MRFEGTHIPGQHTTVVPVPQQIILPERKIIGPAEAEKWHASRGSGVAADEGGGTPILLPGLVEYLSVVGSAVVGQHNGINMSQIRGSTSTFENDAVIAGGRCLDFPVNPSFPDDNAFASGTNALLADWGSASSFMVVAFGRLDSGETGQNLNYACGENDTSGWDCANHDDVSGYAFEVPSSDNSYPGDSLALPVAGNWFATVLKWDLGTETLSGAVNGVSFTSVSVPQGCGPPDITNVLSLQGSFSRFGIMALWAGASLPADADISWFINFTGGQAVGRTYAEVAAYTG